MARSSRHKSSKHSSREARDYSDSERDSGLKERKGKDDFGSGSGSTSSRHLKESASGEKRKLDSKSIEIVKESIVSTNVEYVDEHVSSKKRKEKVDDDRWTGGEDNEVKGLSESKRSSRKEENSGSGFDAEEAKRSGSRVESKHHRSERKERGEKEGGSERERKSSSKSERLVDGVLDIENVGNEGNKKQGNSGEERGGKHSVGNTDSKIQDDFRNSEAEKELDRRVRRKRDGSGDGDRHQNGVQELDDRKLSSRDDTAKSGRYKDDCHKEEKVRDKYREDAEKEHSHQDEKQRDNWPSRDGTSGKSDDKQVRNENKNLDVSQKKSKLHHSEYDRDRDRDREHDRERDRERERDRDRDREMDRDRGRVRDRDHDRNRIRDRDRSRHDHDREHDKDLDDRENDLDRDRDRDRDRDLERSHDRDREPDRDRERGRERYRRERDRDRIRDRDHNHDRGRERDYDHDHDYGSHVDDKGARYKEDRGRRRSPDGYDEYHGDKERSLSRKAHIDSVTSNSRHRNSPSARSYVSSDKYRDGMQDETKYGDSLRDGAIIPEVVDKVPKYRSGEKRAKFDDNHIAELPERSPSTKASPAGLKERSPSSTSVDRRYRSGRRRSLDVDEAERRSSGSNDIRDAPVNEDRQARDFSAKKPLGEDYPPAESLLYHKSSQGNVSSHGPGHGPSGYRAGADSPSFIGSFGDENRGHPGGRYRRGADPNMGRGPGNAWKGVPNWSSPLPNGFMPFPPGPPGLHHGGFPPMMSQFPPPFNVRPSLEMNHPGIPYHMVDADRFPGHVRPMGWPNMVDGSVPPHFHGWDANNGVLRDDPSMFGPGNLSSRGRDMNADLWKPNGDMNMDVTSGSQKDAPVVKTATDEASSGPGASKLQHESSCIDDHGTSVKKNTSSGLSSAKDIPMSPTKVTADRTPESFSIDDSAIYPCSYLAKLDISMDLSDPELYNECVNIGVKEQPEHFDEDMEYVYAEEKSVEPEIISSSRGLTYFPAAKESIFQRAMNLYKNQSIERTYATSKGTEPLNPPAEANHLEEKQSLASDMQVDADDTIKQPQADSTLVIPQEVSAVGDQEGKQDPVPVTSLPSAELGPDVGNEGETLVINKGKVEENISDESIPEVANMASTVDSNVGLEMPVGSVDGKSGVGGSESGSDEQLDVKVSDAVVMCHDSVKVCEAALLPVSNESEVILSRIHHAPESTH